MGIETVDNYLFSYDVNPQSKEVRELQHFEDEGRYEKRWKIEADKLTVIRDFSRSI